MKAKLLSLAMALTIALTGTIGFADAVKAANTANRGYSFLNVNTSATIDWRDKNNDTKVYVYPQAGPNLYYTVHGCQSTTQSNWKVRSSRVLIPNGVQASITNTVNEKGDNQARLKLERTLTGNVVSSGVWSPDSTRNYRIYN